MRQHLIFMLLAVALIGAACSSGTSVFDLEVGDCFNDQADLTETQVSDVDSVSCLEPHDNEVYFEYSMTDAVFPGESAALEAAAFRCVDEFDAFVGIGYLDSELDIFPITPTARSWEEGDRVVYCAIYALDLSKLEGSMRGIRR